MSTKNYIGPYEIISELGRGGMGVVYLAYDANVKRKVAIKVILDTSDQVALKRFVREAKAISELEHNNIVKLYQLSYHENVPYMVMQYVEGIEFHEYIEQYSLDLEDVLRLFIPIIEALHYAHQKGVIHRDIKPSNIIVDNNGKPLLMDFGIAKRTTVEDKSLTQTGTVIGSPGYISPEQANGKWRANHQSDVYACGCILYEIMTGQLPFGGNNAVEMLYNLIYGKLIPLREVDDSIAEDLDIICSKALEKDLQYRYQTAQELAADLKNFVSGEPISAKKRRSLPNPILMMTISLCFVLGIFIAWNVYFGVPEKIEKINKINDPVLLAEGWFKNGFYERGMQELEKAIQSGKIDVAIRHYYNVITLGQMEKNEEFFRCYNSLDFSDKQKPDIEVTKNYIDAISYCNERKYRVALQNFLVIEKNAKNIKNFYVWGKLFFYIGKCYVYDNEYLHAKLYFEKANDLIENVDLYYELGLVYLKLQHYEKAEVEFRKCQKINDNNSDYYIALGDALREQNRIEEAQEQFSNVQKLGSVNFDAFQKLTELSLYDVDLLEEYIFSFLQKMEADHYKLEHVISLYTKRIADKSFESYQKYKNLQTKKHVSISEEMLEKIDNEDSVIAGNARKGIVTLRHQDDFETMFLEKISKSQQKMEESQRKFYDDILRIKAKEKKEALYYLMAKSILSPLVIVISEVMTKDIVEILQDEKEKTEHRYLAALVLIDMLHFEVVIRCGNSGSDILKCICVAALYQRTIPCNIEKIVIPDSTDYFFCVLKAHYYFLWNLDKYTILQLLDHEVPEVVVSMCMAYKGDDEEVKAKIYNVLRDKFVDDDLRKIALSLYWSSIPITGIFEEEWNTTFADIEKQEKCIQLSILKRGTYKNNHPHHIHFPVDTLEQLLVSRVSDDVKILIIKCLKVKETVRVLEAYYHHAENSISTRLYAFVNYFKYKAYKSFEFAKVDVFLASNEPFLRAYGYSYFAVFGGEVLDFLTTETNPGLQAVILQASTTILFPALITDKRKSKSERCKIASNYFSSDNKNIQIAAYGAYVYFLSDAEKMEMVSKHESSNMYAKKGIALGLNHSFRDSVESLDLKNDLSYFIDGFTGDIKYKNLIRYKNKMANPRWVNRYEKIMNAILHFDEQKAEVHFKKALLHIQKEDYKTALLSFKEAISLKEDIFYYIEYIKAYYTKNQTVPDGLEQKVLILIKDIQLEVDYVKSLTHISHSLVEKILKQNCLRDIYVPMEKPDHEEQVESWQLLAEYYKKHGSEKYKRYKID